MGIWIDLFTGPADGRRLDGEALLGLVRDLVDERIVTPRSAIVVGHLSPDSPLSVSNTANSSRAVEPGRLDRDQGPRLVLARATDGDTLLAALERLPEDDLDFAVVFSGLDWENPDLGPALEEEGSSNGDVLVYAFRDAQRIELFDAYDDRYAKAPLHFATYVAVTGKSGPQTLEGTAAEPVLRRHFGELREGVSAS